MHAKDRLILALDVPRRDAAEALCDALGDVVGMFKIGYQLFPLGGYDLARALVVAGQRVFLDLKLFDIGATVARGVASLAPIGADILTVHADPDTISGACEGRGDTGLQIYAVTVLTSWDETALKAHGHAGGVLDLVLRRTELALAAGADGVIASAVEAAALRARFGAGFGIITPGIRPAGAAADDQKRIVTPADAIAAGADRIVIGRPILAASDPAAAARAILTEIADATRTEH